MAMSNRIYAAWEKGGFVARDIELLGESSSPNAMRAVRLKTPQSNLQNISLGAKEFDVVSLKFKFLLFGGDESEYTLDLIQRDENGNIVGGETFVVISPKLNFNPIPITSAPAGNGQFRLTAEIDDCESIEWRDVSDTAIGCANEIVVTPKSGSDAYSVIGIDDLGDLSTGRISLKGLYGIKTLDSSEPGILHIGLFSSMACDSKIVLTSFENGVTFEHTVPTGVDSLDVDIMSVPKGLYVISYIADCHEIDTKKITID